MSEFDVMGDFGDALDAAIKSSENLSDEDLAKQISSKIDIKTKDILKLYSDRQELVVFSKLVNMLKSDLSDGDKSQKLASKEYLPIIRKFMEHFL